MRNPTDMMRAILTNETAQRIIDFVSPIYGDSYVGLWLYQAIGSVMGEICEIAEQLRYETSPATSVLLLDYWEDHYNIPRGTSLTVEQRQNRLLVNIQTRGPHNPATMANAISSSLNGVSVNIVENVAKNTFMVIVSDHVSNLSPAVAVIKKSKPAHLLYRLQMITDASADLMVSSAVTHAETHDLTVGCEIYEDVETSLAPAFAITHSEKYSMEVLN